MVKPVFRRKSIETKVSEEEYASAGRRPGARRVVARGSVPRVGREGRRGRRTNVAGGSPGAAPDPAERLLLRACASQERLTPICILRCYDCDARV